MTINEKIESELDHDFFSYGDCIICEIKRMPKLLHLCGYIFVPSWHPFYNKGDTELNSLFEIDVHGGITYSYSDDFDEWKIGFDCAHGGDISPGIMGSTSSSGIITISYPFMDSSYKDWEFTKNETIKLAQSAYELISENDRTEYSKTISARLARKVLSL